MHQETILPPTSFGERIRWIGPGWILSAAVVGSGELIATTTLGAKAGMELLWVILLGCTVKVAIQIEYGRHAIQHGLTTMQSWNRSGPKIGKFSLSVWVAILYMIGNMFGQAGILGAAAQALGTVTSNTELVARVLALTGLLMILVAHGRYDPVERLAALMNAIFLIGLLASIVMLQLSGRKLGLSSILYGLRLSISKEHIPLALAAFGLTGIAGGEIFLYPYWCLEKGYGFLVGQRTDSGWVDQARNWIKVMELDAIMAMLVYSLATAGFYVLGVMVLHGQGQPPDGPQLIHYLARIFTETLGPWALRIFYACAFAVLFSTVFANTAGWSRVWIDVIQLHSTLIKTYPPRLLLQLISLGYGACCGALFLIFSRPLALVTFLGMLNAAFLVLVSYHGLRYRFRESLPELKPGVLYDVLLLLSAAAIVFVGLRSILA